MLFLVRFRSPLTTALAGLIAAALLRYLYIRELWQERIRAAAKAREDLLTPIAKAWSTDMGVDVASLGVQVHGGMGFMSETLAAQLYRDARIAPIYEGTNGIQAIDLVGRKLAGNGGASMRAMLIEIDETVRLARSTNDPQFVQLAERLWAASKALAETTDWMLARLKAEEQDKALAGATAWG